MFTIIKAVIIILSATAVCLAEANPYYMIHTASLDLDEHGRPPVPTGMDDEQYNSWKKSYSVKVNAAWDSYTVAHASELSKAQVAIEHFQATATDYSVPAYVTEAPPTNADYTTLPDWFTALPEEIQKIKLDEGDAFKSIFEDKSGFAPRETARAALGMLAGVAIAAAVL